MARQGGYVPLDQKTFMAKGKGLGPGPYLNGFVALTLLKEYSESSSE